MLFHPPTEDASGRSLKTTRYVRKANEETMTKQWLLLRGEINKFPQVYSRIKQLRSTEKKLFMSTMLEKEVDRQVTITDHPVRTLTIELETTLRDSPLKRLQAEQQREPCPPIHDLQQTRLQSHMSVSFVEHSQLVQP